LGSLLKFIAVDVLIFIGYAIYFYWFIYKDADMYNFYIQNDQFKFLFTLTLHRFANCV